MTAEGIQVEIYKDNDPHTLVDVINARLEPSYLAEMKNHGAGSFRVSKNDPKVKANPSLLDYRNFVRVRVNGRVVGAFIIQTKKTEIVSSGEYAGEYWSISGEGVRAWFNDASVYPVGGLSQQSKETRFFNFASFRGSWYDAGQWQNPIAYEKWNSKGRKGTAPAEWPDAPNAYWLWGTAFTPPGTPGKSPDGRDHKKGFNYFRYEFTTTDSALTKYALFFGVDDRAEVYVDGELVMTTAEHAWQETNRLDFDLLPGNHVIAMKAYNYRDDGPGGVIAALFRYGDASVPTSARLISVTNATSGWKVCPYPAIEPGWTVGDVLLTLINEAKTRGVRFASNINPMFNEDVDSANLPWSNPLPWEFDVGASYGDVIRALEEAECDVYLDPDTLNLYAWNRRGYDRSKDGDFTNAIIYTPGHNLFAAAETGQADIANRILMRTPSGWTEAAPAESTSVSRYGRIESHFSTDLSGTAATNLVAEMFRQKALPEKSATFSIHVTPGMVPFENFDVGDWVSAPNDQGVHEARRVMSISVTENSETGEPSYAVEFDTIFKDRQSELEDAINRATGASSTLTGFGPSVVKLPSTVIVGNPPPPFIEAMQPDAPIWVSVTGTGTWAPSGLPTATVNLQWTPVSTSNGDPISDIERYELWARRATETQDQVIGVFTDTFATLEGVPAGTDWVYRVRAIGRVNGEGVFSSNFTFTTPFPVEELDPPSQPSLASDLSLVIVNWDGLLGGEIPPASFRRVFAEFRAGTTGSFTRVSGYATKAGQVATIRATPGDSIQVHLIAEDSLGRETDPSPVQSITVVGVGVPDIASDLADAIQDAVDKAQQAIDTVSSVDGRLTTSPNAPTAADGANKPVGAVWFRSNGAGNFIGSWEWDGDSWEPRTFDGAILEHLDAGSIDVGFLDVLNRIRAGSIFADKVVIGAGDNLIPGGSFKNGIDGWQANKAGVWSVDAETATLMAAGGQDGDDWIQSQVFPVQPETQYRLSAEIMGDLPGAVFLRILWYKADGTPTDPLYSDAIGSYAATPEFVVPSGLQVRTSPAGAASARVRIYAWQGTAAAGNPQGTATDFIRFRNLAMRPMTSGVLIEDGAVTSNKVNTAELWANAAWIDAATVGVLRAGVIEVDMLSPAVGESLDISANGSVNIIIDAQASLFESVSANTEAAENAANLAATASDIAGAAQGDAAVAAEAAELARQAALAAQAAVEDISVYYRFTAEGAIIGRTDSPFQLRLANDRAEFTENGVVTTYWESGQMFVPELVSPIVTLGNHRIEKYGTRTVVRAV